ncbi:esterase-like activity of phytase family protein [Christiangramia aquimixticola]|uniref:esterase-like activity of phytase family protein n=1 Tax=Christiangramia aquimixticola TaxID=1697558 RepID=UPI003AA84FE6
MKNSLFFCLVLLCLTGCGVTRTLKNDNVQLKFLDDFVLPADLNFENTRVGGLSGIDYKNGTYYLVSDQASDPRIYKANIQIEDSKIEKIEINELIKVTGKENFSDKYFDLEAIRYDELRDEYLIASEGMIDSSRDPGIFRLNSLGEVITEFNLPDYFKAKGQQKPRNNGVFEGLSESFDQQGYWVATELPLEMDSSKPKVYPSKSHVRITKFDKNTGEPVRQFIYQLDGIAKLPINYFAVNGITEILEYAPDKFLILERAYSAGYGSHGNTVKIFEADATEASNTLEMKNLRKSKYKKSTKNLLFNFKKVEKQLSDKIIDNIEGMTLGPVLENGKRSLILVSDNNFNSFAKQINQFILMEINFQN